MRARVRDEGTKGVVVYPGLGPLYWPVFTNRTVLVGGGAGGRAALLPAFNALLFVVLSSFQFSRSEFRGSRFAVRVRSLSLGGAGGAQRAAAASCASGSQGDPGRARKSSAEGRSGVRSRGGSVCSLNVGFAKARTLWVGAGKHGRGGGRNGRLVRPRGVGAELVTRGGRKRRGTTVWLRTRGKGTRLDSLSRSGLRPCGGGRRREGWGARFWPRTRGM